MAKTLSSITAFLSILFLAPYPSFGHGGEPFPGSTFEEIQQEIFTQTCALQSCHGSFQAGGLSLEDDAYHNLVGVTPANPTASAAGKLLVAPGDLDNSFLWHKINALLEAGEGAAMPLGTQGLIALRPDLVDLIGDWILAGAPEDGVVEGAGGGGGDFAGEQPEIQPLAPAASRKPSRYSVRSQPPMACSYTSRRGAR